MFTGIIRGIGKVEKIRYLQGFNQYSISMDKQLLLHIERGASIAIDGICLTVTNFSANEAAFDAISETLTKTTLKFIKENDLLNIERAARFGDEIGGHILSGHIFGTATIHSIDVKENHCAICLKCPLEWMEYIFPKGYLALNGVSLTVVHVDKMQGLFSVHLIPETLEKTTFGLKKVTDLINVEIDTQTQVIVDTLKAIYKNNERG